MGGHWGAELKFAGYDGIIVQGKAEKPVYVWIADGKVEILDAGHLWGRGTYGTTLALRATHGHHTRVISCGQAGERLSRIAVIQTETGNAAGQGGFGGVMGSKNLKAIAVRGTSWSPDRQAAAVPGPVHERQPRGSRAHALRHARVGRQPGQEGRVLVPLAQVRILCHGLRVRHRRERAGRRWHAREQRGPAVLGV